MEIVRTTMCNIGKIDCFANRYYPTILTNRFNIVFRKP